MKLCPKAIYACCLHVRAMPNFSGCSTGCCSQAQKQLLQSSLQCEMVTITSWACCRWEPCQMRLRNAPSPAFTPNSPGPYHTPMHMRINTQFEASKGPNRQRGSISHLDELLQLALDALQASDVLPGDAATANPVPRPLAHPTWSALLIQDEETQKHAVPSPG
jgi:hypothetical protein